MASAGPFFRSAHAIGVYLDTGAVETQNLDPDQDHLLPLQVIEHAVQDAVPRLPVHARVDGVPVAEMPRQRPRHLQPCPATQRMAWAPTGSKG